MQVRTFVAAIALAALFANASSAQTSTADRITTSLSFGSGYSTIRSDLFSTENGRLGYAAGLSFVVPMGSRLELNPEISFTQKGATAQAGLVRVEDEPLMTTYRYNYKAFELGVLVGYQPFASVPVRLQLGGFLDANQHNLDERDDLFVGDLYNYNAARPASDLNDAFGGLDYGPAMGLSAGGTRFRVNFRYYLGVPNLYNYLEFMPEGHSIRTSAFRLSATYLLF